jgi:hypothetical protein
MVYEQTIMDPMQINDGVVRVPFLIGLHTYNWDNIHT